MKRYTFSLLVLATAVLIIGGWSWAACPEEPLDNGICDTLRVTTPDAIQTGAGPWYVRFPLWITHDVPNPIDSIAALVIPLCYTNTNPTKYCSVSAYMNQILWGASQRPRSIFRHLIVGSDTTHNWMMDRFNEELGEEWNGVILDLTGGTSHFWLTLIPSGSEDVRFGTGNHTLMATMTFKIQDTMHVSIDTCLWPPSSHEAFARADGPTYVPRDNMPATFWIGPPLWVTAPNGGETWAIGTTHNITWGSEGYAGAKVKIQYSINSGANWLSVVDSTLNTGSYPWLIPNNPSTNCRVKVSGLTGDPHDSSDANFTIEQPPPPDFSLAVTPDTRTVEAGQSTPYTVNLGAINGFSNPVTLSMSVIEASTGITSDFTSNPVTPPGSSTMNVHTTVATVPATYRLIVTGTYTSLVHKDTVTLIVTPVPDFTIDANPDTQQVIAGNDTSYNVILLSQNGFSHPCTLTTSTLPGGVSASFSINPVTPSDTVIMAVSTTAGVTPAGTYKITITGTEQTKAQKSTDVYLVVNVPDFTIDAPETLVLLQGEDADYTVTLTSLYGFNSACTLTVSGLPDKVTGAFAPPNVTPPGASTLTITADMDADIGKYPLIITGTKLSAKTPPVLAHSDTVILDLKSQKEFNLTVFPETLHVPLGESNHYRVKLLPVSGFNSPCSLSVTGFVTGITGSFAHSVLIPEDSTVLNISVACNAQVTTHTLTITATEIGGTLLQHSQDVVLSVDMGTWSFIFATNPDSQKAVVGDSAVYQVLIRRQPCFLMPCTLSVIGGLPTGASCYFKPTIIPGSDSTSNLVVSSGTAIAGSYHLIVKGKAQAKPEIRDTLKLKIQDFDISSSQDTAIVTQGQSAGCSITLTSLFGFAERCTLMVSILPPSSNPPSGELDKITLIPTDNAFLNLNTTTGTDTGWYDITVSARRMIPGKAAVVLEHSLHIALKVNEGSDVNDGQDNPNAPKTFALFQNQPNPFNPTTEISYYLPQASRVKLTVYNVLGQSVRILYDGYQEAGMQNVTWDGRSADGNELSSGIYFYRLQAGDFNQTKKMSLMK